MLRRITLSDTDNGLRCASRERVAIARPPRVEPALEPAHPLLRGPVRERFRNDTALALLLQAVVADRGCRIESFRDVALLELVHVAGMITPDARVAVGLQLHAHRHLIEIRF